MARDQNQSLDGALQYAEAVEQFLVTNHVLAVRSREQLRESYDALRRAGHILAPLLPPAGRDKRSN